MPQDESISEFLGMLSEEQVRALREALNRPDPPPPGVRPLSEEQMKGIRAEVNSYREAQRKAAEAIGVLWNARLDLALHGGDMASIHDALLRPIGDVAFYDNCDCGGGGGGGTGYW